MNPGDSFFTKFWFHSENGTKFGIASYEEMNKAILLYYPAKKLLRTSPWSCTYDIPLAACNASMTSRALSSSGELERIFGRVPSSCQDRNEPRKTDMSMARGIHLNSLFASIASVAVAACLFM